MVAALVLLTAIIFSSGCGLVQGGSEREVGERFSETLEGRSAVPIEDYLAPDADIFLQGGLHLSRQAFHDHLDNMRGGYAFWHRMSPVYATRSGAGWLLDIIHAADPDTAAGSVRSAQQATMWIEVTIDSGHIKRLWIVFTKERVESLLQSPAIFAAKTRAQGLSLPTGWADGTAAVVAAAEALDAQIESSEADTNRFFAAPITAVAAGLLVLRVLVARRNRQPADLMAASLSTRNGALLAAMRERRERGFAEDNSERSVPV